MRGKKAKTLRRQIYGKNFSFRVREYIKDNNGAIVCIGKRHEYQALKKGL